LAASATPTAPAVIRSRPQNPATAAIQVRGVSRRFKGRRALRHVSLAVDRGTVHALLGPNGAGKTTLLRILTGLVAPTSGDVSLLGAPVGARTLRSKIGFIPAGDRSFYLRISGRENLVFFARLHGFRRREAAERADEALESVGLSDAARLRVGAYSHGMQKRLSIARALLSNPEILLVDEATHDLDPHGAVVVRKLVTELAERGATVLWTTQRLEEIRGFADRVTLLRDGATCFTGTVPELMTHAVPRRYLLRIRNGVPDSRALEARLRDALDTQGTITAQDDVEHFLLALAPGAILGEAIAALTADDVQVLTCREEQSEIEEAFLKLTRTAL